MKLNLLAKLLIAVCLCLITALTFVACKDKEIYAESSDFESYPDYWNDFNDDNGDIYVSKEDQTNTITTPSDDDASTTSDGDELTSSEKEFVSNFKDNIGENDEEDDNTSSTVDTDNDGTPDDTDTDDDNDGVTDDKDDDDDGDGILDKNEADYGHQGPFVPNN